MLCLLDSSCNLVGRGEAISFTAKIKTTNELFQATTDFGTDGQSYRDAVLPCSTIMSMGDIISRCVLY
jgi:hypothetical protein